MTTMHLSAVFLTALLTVSAGCAGRKPAGPPPSGTLAEGLITVTAKVTKVDLKTRKVTLELPDGTTQTVTVDKRVVNLPQVKAGDMVGVSYFESIAYAVRRKGEATPGVTVAEEALRAQPGEMPGGAVAVVTTITATITDIDKRAGTVTITGPGGNAQTVRVRDASNLDRIAKGDLVEITITEALATAVEPLAPK